MNFYVDENGFLKVRQENFEAGTINDVICMKYFLMFYFIFVPYFIIFHFIFEAQTINGDFIIASGNATVQPSEAHAEISAEVNQVNNLPNSNESHSPENDKVSPGFNFILKNIKFLFKFSFF